MLVIAVVELPSIDIAVAGIAVVKLPSIVYRPSTRIVSD